MATEKEEIEQDPRESLRNFVTEEKVRAFLRRYEPFEDNGIDYPDKTFSEQALRKFFGAYPKTLGDPLVIYIDEYLSPAGFSMDVDDLAGEPVIKVRIRHA